MTENIEKQRNQSRIFISYARADDEPFVEQLYQDLTERGFDIWWDRKAMESRGLTFLQEIRDAIEGSDRLIAVIGPNAVKSEYVKVEWEHGLLFAKAVTPILRLGDFDLIPQEIPKVHCPDFRKKRTYKNALDELVRILKESVPPLGTFHTSVPSLPAHFQSRRVEITRIGEAVLADIQRPTVITSAKQTTAIVGMGGSGKSVLAAAFARATDTRRAFTDGVFWLSIGQSPDILTSLRLIGLGFKDNPENYVDIERAKASLPKVLGDKVCLIVLDDIWNVNHVAPFKDALGSRCRLLITTRDSSIVTASGAKEYHLGMLNDGQALALLAEWADQAVETLPPEAHMIADECGNLPLAIAMIGAMIRSKPNRWSNALHKLQGADLEKIRQQFPNYPYPDILRAIQVSVEALEPDFKTHYLDFAVFPHKTTIPEAVLQTFWEPEGLDEFDIQDIADMLVDRSLAQRDKDRLMLHDIQHDYLRATAGDLNLKNLHEKLLAAYQKKCKDGWASGPKDGYFFKNLAYHLIEAGRKEELQKLLFDFAWIHAKLEAVEVNALIRDYDFFSLDRTLSLVQKAIRLSAHILARDKKQLRSQLYGRLIGQDSLEIKTLLDKIKQWKDRLWLCHITPCLIPPGGSLICTLEGHTGPVFAVSFLPDGKRAISSSEDETLKVWDLESGKVLNTLEGHTGAVSTVSILPDGKRAISAGFWDHILRVWDLESGKVLNTLEGHTDSVRAVSVLPDGKRAISGSSDKTLRVWDLESGKVLNTLEGHTHIVNAVSVLPDGKRAISGSNDGTLKVWNLEKGVVLYTFQGHTGSVRAVSVLPDGKRAISGSGDYTLKVWDLESGKVLNTLEGHTHEVSAVSILPDGKQAISGSNDGTLRVWDLESGEVLNILEGHTGCVSAMSILPDGKRAISSSDDKTLRVWDLESGKVLNTLEGHTGAVSAVSVLPGGERAISRSIDSTLKVWDLKKREVIISFTGDNSLCSIAVTQDGKTIIAGEESGKVHFLRLEENGITPETQSEHKIACPKCNSDDVTFSKKKQLYVCPDCHYEFVIEKKTSS